MAHTPMRSLSQEYGARPVMVCGKGALLDIAASYGFRRVVSTEQLADAFPKSVPISSFSASSEGKQHTPTPGTAVRK